MILKLKKEKRNQKIKKEIEEGRIFLWKTV